MATAAPDVGDIAKDGRVVGSKHTGDLAVGLRRHRCVEDGASFRVSRQVAVESVGEDFLSCHSTGAHAVQG